MDYNNRKYQPRLVEIDGILYEPTAPILMHKDDNGEVWVQAKEYRGFWQRQNQKRKELKQ